MSTAEQTKEQTAEKPAARATFPGPHKTIAAALVAAQLNAKAVEKDSTNDYHKYKYASAEALIEEARYALNIAGLATIMERWEILPPHPGREFERVKVYFKTIHDASIETLVGDVEYHIVPEKGRPDDKATATALTYAEGYYLRGLLCLPRVDADTDVDQRNDRNFDPARRRNQNQGRNQQRGDQQRGGQGRNQQRGQGQQPLKRIDPQKYSASGPANGQAQQSAPAGNGSKSAANGSANGAGAPTGESKHSERYQWWRARIVNGELPAGQLRGMVNAIKKDERITDEAERAQLAEMAEREAISIESAAERASSPPQ